MRQTARRFDFVGSERDFESHILDNVDDIARACGWGEISRIERQFTVKFVGHHIIVDVMLWHSDGTGTVIECKTGKTNRNDLLTSIGQVLFYGANLSTALGQMPRLVIAAPFISPYIHGTIKRFDLPICLLSVDGNQCTYLS